jgi:cytochrome c oxidase assembly protein subunit 15
MVGVTLLVVFLFQLSAEAQGRPSGISYRQGTPAGIRAGVWATWIYTYLAIYWGSYVAFRGAGEACPTWPLCNGKVFPGFQGLVGLDFIHRLVAVGLAIITVLLLWSLRKYKGIRPDLYKGAFWLLLAVITQIITGANLALSHVATGPYLLHIGNLMLLFGDISYLTLQVVKPGKTEPSFDKMPPRCSSPEVQNPQG